MKPEIEAILSVLLRSAIAVAASPTASMSPLVQHFSDLCLCGLWSPTSHSHSPLPCTPFLPLSFKSQGFDKTCPQRKVEEYSPDRCSLLCAATVTCLFKGLEDSCVGSPGSCRGRPLSAPVPISSFQQSPAQPQQVLSDCAS